MTDEEKAREWVRTNSGYSTKEFHGQKAIEAFLAGLKYNNKQIAELEKENAELKGIKDIATLIRANNDTVITLMQLNNMLVSKNQQLIKAKEIIKKFSEFVNNEVEFDPEHPQEHTDLWNELCEKAEQFLRENE